jgi:hypothetical protein
MILYGIMTTQFCRRLAAFSIAAIVMFKPGCKKFVNVSPPVTSLNAQNVYSSDQTAAAVLTGIYASISAATIPFATGGNSISALAGLSADELTLYNGVSNVTLTAFYKNNLESIVNTNNSLFWGNIYQIIFKTNDAIGGLSTSVNISDSAKRQLLGEAKFMRAFCYFYLVNLYGDIPLAISSDFKANSVLPRTEKAIVYQQIISDLKDAQDLLNSNYVESDAKTVKATTERIRPVKWAAASLLSRVYLFSGDFIDAEIQSTLVIDNALYKIDTLGNAFLKNSTSVIWQLQPVNSGWNTEDARAFVIPSTGPSNNYPVYLSSSLLNSFEAGDLRKTKWISKVISGGVTYYYPYKYKSATSGAAVTEYLDVLRLSELYLIRAEARAQLGESNALDDLNKIRNRSGLLNYSGNMDKSSISSAVLHERQVELFTEWGHRWLDIKRTGNIDAVMNIASLAKGATWNTNWQLYPIPSVELQRNLNLTQNTGY